jgi:hypothetical protein
MTMNRVTSILLGAVLLLAPLAAPAQAQDCSSLPASAQRARTCNPQQECVAKVEGSLKSPALDAARKDCQRLPTAGTCYGPETYNPQAECRERQGKKK